MGIGTRTAIADTGPPLHLCEINQESQIALFDLLIVSQFVCDELASHNVWERLKRLGLNLRVEMVAESQLAILRAVADSERLSNADLSVWFLARIYRNALILTDDLALRKVLENEGFLVVGSVGILFRAYTEGRSDKAELIQAIKKLFTESSLYLSEGLKRRVMKRLRAIDC